MNTFFGSTFLMSLYRLLFNFKNMMTCLLRLKFANLSCKLIIKRS